MKNVQTAVNGNILTITVDLSKEFGLSKSGKTVIIATTSGSISIDSDDRIKLGLNIYRYPEEK